MEIIKYRAWSLKNKIMMPVTDLTWHEGKLVYIRGTTSKGVLGGHADYVNLKKEFVLMQYTGLKDKNKKEIYEGDIVKYPKEIYKMFREVGYKGGKEGLELVVWSKENTAFMGKDINRSIEYDRSIDVVDGKYLWVMEMPKKSEVVGNRHETPILLTEDILGLRG